MNVPPVIMVNQTNVNNVIQIVLNVLVHPQHALNAKKVWFYMKVNVMTNVLMAHTNQVINASNAQPIANYAVEIKTTAQNVPKTNICTITPA